MPDGLDSALLRTRAALLLEQVPVGFRLALDLAELCVPASNRRQPRTSAAPDDPR